MSTTLDEENEQEEDPLLWEPLETTVGTDPASFSAKPGGHTWQTTTSRQQQKEETVLTTGASLQDSTDRNRTPPQEGHCNNASSTQETSSSSTPQGAAAPDFTPDLLNHPMQLAWSRFFIYFGQELWEIDLHLRFAIILVLTGFAINTILSSSYFFWSPRWILFAMLLFGPLIYLERNEVAGYLQALGQTIVSPERLARALGNFEPSTVRTLFLSTLLIPTLFEARALVFLSHIKAEAGWSLYNVTVAVALLVLQLALYRYMRLSPRECSQKAVVLLYGAALVVSCWRTDWRRLPWLVAPFFTSTGVLIWNSGRQPHDQNVLSNVLRQALRRTLRDVVQHVGTTVQRDEMLQLALLRWLVAYWTTTTTDSSTENVESNIDPTTGNASTITPTHHSEASTPRASNPKSSTSTMSSTRAIAAPNELEWQDVFAMLRVTAEQMSMEANNLRRQETSSSCGSTQQSSQDDPRPSLPHATQPPVFPDSDPFRDLKAMLLSWDIDETAKPAVQTIQRGVAAFPPEQKFVIFFSVARRSPAFLAMLYQIAVGHYFCWSALLILSALISFEVVRLHEWIVSCHLATTDNQQTVERNHFDHADVLQNLDPMLILLSDDLHQQDRPSPLLRVWWNLEDSVAALETGLKTARCAQSTAIAADFADNIMSLARFGLEVQEYGFTHGLMVALQEIFAFNNHDMGPTAGYAHAAYGAFYNGRRLYRNAKAMSEEGELRSNLLPLLGLVPVLIGHGWLWAQQQSSPLAQTQKSTVVIEEIVDTDEIKINPSPAKQSGIREGKLPPVRPESRTDSTSHDAASSTQPSNEEDTRLLEKLQIEKPTGSTTQLTGMEDERASNSLPKPAHKKSPQATSRAPVETVPDDGNQQAAGLNQFEDRTRLMDLIAKCQINGLLDETDKNRICEDMARFGGSVDTVWLSGTIRTLEGLLEEHEQMVVTPLESSTDDLFSVTLRSSVMENQSINTGVVLDLAASDEWEGLGTNTNSSKASLDSLVPVEAHEAEDAPEHPDQQDSTSNPPAPQATQESETSKILLSVAAIGAAAFGAFVASRSTSQDQTDRRRKPRDGNHTDQDWVQVERRDHD